MPKEPSPSTLIGSYSSILNNSKVAPGAPYPLCITAKRPDRGSSCSPTLRPGAETLHPRGNESSGRFTWNGSFDPLAYACSTSRTKSSHHEPERSARSFCRSTAGAVHSSQFTQCFEGTEGAARSSEAWLSLVLGPTVHPIRYSCPMRSRNSTGTTIRECVLALSLSPSSASS